MPIPRHRTGIDEVTAVSMVAAALGLGTTKRAYPCDDGPCPFGEGGGMYFCRDNCGLGVDEDEIPERGEY